MSTLVVEVDDTERRLTEQFTFDASPVRIGRSQLNELPLPFDFVSHCHGILTFRPGCCEYMDLGSTNGTYLGRTRLSRNVPHALAPDTVLSIGKLRLVAHEASASAPSRHSYAFDAAKLLEEVERRALESARPPAEPIPSYDPAELAHLYAQYRESWRALFGYLRAHYKPLAPTTRERFVSDLLRACPDLPQEHAFRALVGSGLERGGTALRIVSRLTGAAMPATAERSPAEVEQQLTQLVERSMQAFLELREGHQRFLSEMGLGVAARDRAALSEVASAEAALRYLLGPGAGRERLEELTRAYTDIMSHQVALLNGVLAGARELLGTLADDEIALPSAGVLRWLGFLRRGRRRSARRELLRDLQDEGALTAALFGRAFARAYAASLGQHRAATPPSTSSIAAHAEAP